MREGDEDMVETMTIMLLIGFIIISIRCVNFIQRSMNVKEIILEDTCHKKSKV